jgi:sugar phosphate permease
MFNWLKKHYYWIIVIVMMLQTTIYGGIANTLASIYTIPVTTELEMSRASFSLAISMRPFILFLGTTFSGPVFQRFGVKKPLLFGLFTLTIGYALLSVCEAFLPMAFSCALIGFGESFVGTAAISRVVNNWFHRHQGSLLGLVAACTGLGGGVFSVVLSSVIQSAGWRSARLISAMCLLVAALAILFALRENPENLQLRPFGEGYVPKKKERRGADEHWEGYSFNELLKKPVFYLTGLAFFLAGVCIYSAFTTIVPHLQDKGLSASNAAFLNGLMLTFLAVFKFGCGSVSDMIGAKRVSCICMIACAVGLWLLPEVNSFAAAIPVIVIYTLSVAFPLVVLALVTYPLFGYRSHDASLGVFLALPYAGSLVIVPVTNAIYDSMGSYDLVFRVSAVLSIVVLGLFFIIFAMAKKDQRTFEKQHTSSESTQSK